MDAIDALGEFVGKQVAVQGQQRPGHKYLKREPTNDPNHPWKYIYTQGQSQQAAAPEEAKPQRAAAPEQAKQKPGAPPAQAKPQAGAQPQQATAQQGAQEPAKPPPKRHWIESVTEHGLPKDTQKHYAPDGEYTPERKQLHERLIAKFFDHVPSVDEKQKPVAVLTMGGTASGKSTLVKHLMGAAHDFVKVNPDDFKEELPEYQRGIALGRHGDVPVSAKDAAGAVHEESADLANELRKRSIAARKNMIIDRTGADLAKTKAAIESLRAAGYHVRLIMPHVPFELAQKRAIERADKEGRYVNEREVLKNHHLAPGNFPELTKLADDWALYASGGDPPPRPVWSGRGGEASVHDDTYVHEFQRVGKERHDIARKHGWLKSWIERTLRKAMESDKDKAKDDRPPSVSLEEMMERAKVNRGEAPDNSTGLDWDFDDDDAKADEKKPEPEKTEKAMDAIDALEPLVKAGERAGHKYVSREPDGRGGWKYKYPNPTTRRGAAPAQSSEKKTTRHDATVGDLCGCPRCDAVRTASLASSRAMAAVQAAAWRPRSRRLAAARDRAVLEREAAQAALDEIEKSEDLMDAIDVLAKAAGIIPRQPPDAGVETPKRATGFTDTARSATEAAAVDADMRREESDYQSLYGKKRDKKKGKKTHPVSEAQRRWAFAAEERGELPKGMARKWSRRVKEGTASMKSFVQRGDTLTKSGLWYFDLSRKDANVSSVPENLLYDYLCAFIEEAHEREKREPQHRNPTAGEDIYAARATPVMHELVAFIPKNPNLKRAVQKFNVTAEVIAEILKKKGFVKPPTDGHHDHGDYWSHDWDSMTSMGVTESNSPVGEVLMASMRADPAEARPGVALRKGGGPTFVQYPEDDARLIGPVDLRVSKRGYVESAVSEVNPDCLIHGVRDLTKAQNLRNEMAVCRC